ncbi:MAG: hypothetical protein ACQEP8_06775, partial [Chlamydiota bacterium]
MSYIRSEAPLGFFKRSPIRKPEIQVTADPRLRNIAKKAMRTEVGQGSLRIGTETSKVIDSRGAGLQKLEAEELPIIKRIFRQLIKYLTFFNSRRIGSQQRFDINYRVLGEFLGVIPADGQLSKSKIMRYFVHQLRSDDDQRYRQALARGIPFQERVEVLQKESDIERLSKPIDRLSRAIQKELEGLESEDSLLMPGGWYSSTENRFIDGYYEIIKTAEGNFDIKWLSVDAADQEHFTRQDDPHSGETFRAPVNGWEGVEPQKLFDSITPLLELQMPALYRQPEAPKGVLAKYREAFQTLQEGEASQAVELSPRHIMNKFYGEKPKKLEDAQHVEEVFSSQTSAAKTTEIFLKIHQPQAQDYRSHHLQRELSTFYEVCHESSDLLVNESFRSLLGEAARKLASELQDLDDKQLLNNNIDRIKEVLNVIHSYQQDDCSLSALPIEGRSFESSARLEDIVDFGKLKSAQARQAPKLGEVKTYKLNITKDRVISEAL